MRIYIRIISSVAVLIALLVFLTFSPYFNIESIDVIGNESFDRQTIVKTSGVEIGTNGFRKSSMLPTDGFGLKMVNAGRKIIAAFPLIKSADVCFHPPNRVVIRIGERKPLFLIPYMGAFLVVDEESYVLRTVKIQADIKIPVLQGISVNNCEPGRQMNTDDQDRFADAVLLAAVISNSDNKDKLDLWSRISSIDMKDRSGCKLLLDSKIRVNLGEPGRYVYNIDYLKQIFFKHVNKNDKGMIDFTTGENPIFKIDK